MHDAEDVTQAAFVDAYRAVLRGSEPQSPRAWLLTIAENVRRRRYRNALRRPREEPMDADFPVTAELPHELAQSLAEALGDLPEEQRAALVLREIAGLSYDEIAAETDSTVGAIQMQLFRARRALRERLEPPVVSRRRTGVFALPGWLTTLFTRADVTLLTPRAAGAVGAAAAAVVGVTVAVSEVAPPVSTPVAQASPPLVSSARSADPVTAPPPGGAEPVVRSVAVVLRARSASRRAAPLRAMPKRAMVTSAAATPQPAPASAPQPMPAAGSVVVVTRPAAPVADASKAPVRAAAETVEQALERPRLPVPVPVPVPVVEAEPVLEVPGPPPLPTAPVTEVVTGAARAAGGGAQPLPVPGLPPITVPPAP